MRRELLRSEKRLLRLAARDPERPISLIGSEERSAETLIARGYLTPHPFGAIITPLGQEVARR